MSRAKALQARRNARFALGRLLEIQEAYPAFSISIDEAVRAANRLIEFMDEVIDLFDKEVDNARTN